MPFKDKNKKKTKRKKGRKFIYNNATQNLEKEKEKKKNPFEELSKKKHTKQMKEFKGIISEYKNRFTTNTFIDRRIGENSRNLSQDEKMKLRFKAQQLINLKNKKNKFSLLNDDEDNIDDHILTHKGKKLNQLDEFEDLEKSDDEIYDKMDNYMEEMDNNKKLSRKEIIQNIINKSKMLKMEKQKLKQETKDKIQMLDDNFGELSNLLKKRGRTFNTAKDDYDKFTKIFEYADKTHPTEKIKTEKEIQIEKENQLKKENKKRIKEEIAALDNEEDEDNKEAPDENIKVDKQLTKKERIEKLIAERLKKSEKIKKDDIIKKRKKDNNIQEENGENEDEEEDNASDLGEFGDDGENEEYEEGEYDEEGEDFEGEDEYDDEEDGEEYEDDEDGEEYEDDE